MLILLPKLHQPPRSLVLRDIKSGEFHIKPGEQSHKRSAIVDPEVCTSHPLDLGIDLGLLVVNGGGRDSISEVSEYQWYGVGRLWERQRDTARFHSVCQSEIIPSGCGCAAPYLVVASCLLLLLAIVRRIWQLRRETYLWIIEDRPGSVVWVGQMEVLKAKTDGFFMPMSETKFQFVSAHWWYKFQKKQNKTKQTAEGVDKLIHLFDGHCMVNHSNQVYQRNRDPEFWLLHCRRGQPSSGDSGL